MLFLNFFFFGVGKALMNNVNYCKPQVSKFSYFLKINLKSIKYNENKISIKYKTIFKEDKKRS